MGTFKERIKVVIFGTDTWAGKMFDLALILTIVLSIITVLLESVTDYSLRYGAIFNSAEWIFTALFTVEYFLRI